MRDAHQRSITKRAGRPPKKVANLLQRAAERQKLARSGGDAEGSLTNQRSQQSEAPLGYLDCERHEKKAASEGLAA